MVDGGGLENHCTRKGTGGSNPSLSASLRSRELTPKRELRLGKPGEGCLAEARSAKADFISSSFPPGLNILEDRLVTRLLLWSSREMITAPCTTTRSAASH